MVGKFYGPIGYGVTTETSPGVWEDSIIERSYYGDVERLMTRQTGSDKANKDISVGNTVSIVADAYAVENFSAIRYVEWSGVRWTVDSVTVQSPRLLLSLGEVYNGPIPD